MNRRVLITGGTGFVGSHAVEQYLAAGWTVRALVRDSARLVWLQSLPVEIAVGKLTDRASLAAAAQDCDLVVHCAAVTKVLDPQEFYRINGTAVEDLALAAREQGVKRFVLCSTQAAAGPSPEGRPLREDDPPRPISHYGRSKLEGEQRLRGAAGDMEWVILRPPAIIGPRDEQFVPLFHAVAHYGIYPRFGSGEQLYSFIAVRDFARALRMAGEAIGGLNDVYFVTNPESLNWKNAARVIARFAGKRAQAIPLGETILRFMAPFTELYAKWRAQPALLNRDKITEILAPGWLCSGEKLRRAWGFQCELSCEATLRETYEDYRRTGRI